MGNLGQDLKYALRTLRQSPGFAAVAVLTLALGVGANIAIFTVVNAVLLRPLPLLEPERLVRMVADLPAAGARDVGMSPPELFDVQDQKGLFEMVSAAWPVSAALTGGDHAERIELLGISVNYFELLGAKAAVGRVFGPQDAALGFSDGVVISDALWKRQFGGDRSVIGRRVRMDNDAYTIIGVMPPEFRHPGRTTQADVDMWAAAGFRADPFPHPPQRGARFVPGTMARLARGVSLAQAQAQLDALVAQWRAAYSKDYPPAVGWALRLEPVLQDLTADVRPTLVLLLGAVGFLLLLVCVNLAGLQMARSSARGRELAIRQALGASRHRLVRQLLTESVLLSLAGGLAALAVLWSVGRGLAAALPADLPRLSEVHFDARVVALAFALSLITGIIFGLTPALQASRSDPNTDLKEGGRSGSSSAKQHRFRSILVASEIGMAVVLLVGTGLLMRSFWHMLQVDPGLDPKNLVVAQIWIPVPNDPAKNPYRTFEQREVLARDLLRRASALPGVRQAAIGSVNSVPFPTAARNTITVSLLGEADPEHSNRAVEFTAVTPEFFQVLKTPLKQGRVFTDDDNTKSKRVVVVNEAFTRTSLSKQDLMGRRLKGGPNNQEWEIVGIVGDLRDEGLDLAPAPRVYFSIYQISRPDMTLFLRSEAAPASLLEPVSRMVRDKDPDLPVYGVRAMEELMAASMSRRRFALSLMGGFAILALFLSALGIYALMAFAVNQRNQEFGVRMALGAQRGDILMLVFRPGLGLALGGALAGLAGAVALTRALTSFLVGVSPVDPLTFAGVPALLALVTLAACWIPAWRASRVAPSVALKSS